MTKKRSKRSYRCGKHGVYRPAFDRVIDGYKCPRVLCETCEKLSYSADKASRPKNIPYFYNGRLAVILQEAHSGSAVWKFNPPVFTTTWHFAKDLTPVIPKGALTPEQLMDRMQAMLPELEKEMREKMMKCDDQSS